MGGRVGGADWWFALAVALAGVLLVYLRVASGIGWAPPWVEYGAELVAAAAVPLRKRRPLVLLAVVAAASLVVPPVAGLVAMYAVGAYVDDVRASVVALLVAVGFTLPAWLVTSEPTGPATLWAGTLALVGLYAAGRRRREQRLAARAAAELAARRAREGTRRTLARELHDVVSHRLGYVVVGAEGIAVTTAEEDTRTMAERIAGAARAALAELRVVLRALADPEADAAGAAAASSAADLHAVVAEARDAGQAVHIELHDPDGTPEGLAGRTFAQVAREGIANAVRHAPGAEITVRVAPVEGGERITIENGPATAEPTGLTGGGFGLDGLRERVALLGGDLKAGPMPAGGFRLQATIPKEER